VNSQEYRQNRARFTLGELEKHKGHWVAFSLDGRRIIAVSADLAALDALVIIADEDPERIALERIDTDDICLGGAELH
jgi:hypothetical protein